MFALEISFQDGVSQPETIFIRRPQALIGASESSHVVVEDMKSLDYQIHILRDIGRQFRCKPAGTKNNLQVPGLLEGVYDGQASFDLGPVKFQITALDSDLPVKETEPPDRAGVRILRLACTSTGPMYPAVFVQGQHPVTISFVPDQPLYIGRSKHCQLRLESADISAKHARVGFESGEFWVEDLGSTNGTFVNQSQISGRVTVPPGVPITLGREIAIIGVISDEQAQRSARPAAAPERTRASAVSTARETQPSPTPHPSSAPHPAAPERRYPVLVSVSEVARPARLVVQPGATLNLGRDPSSDMWLGAPHISRRHCVVEATKTGAILVTDQSTNGTGYDNLVLKRGEVLEIEDTPKVFEFGGGVTVALCFDEEQENAFSAAHGSPYVFMRSFISSESDHNGGSGRTRRERRMSRARDGERDVGSSNSTILDKIRNLYLSLSGPGKMIFIATCVALMVVLIIMANLAMPVFV